MRAELTPNLAHRPPEFDESLVHFTALRKVDPYRLDDLDVLSNILYVSEKRAELATLAQEYMRVDRVRPETCCLVGESPRKGQRACSDILERSLIRARAVLALKAIDVDREVYLQATTFRSAVTTKRPSRTSVAPSSSTVATCRLGRSWGTNTSKSRIPTPRSRAIGEQSVSRLFARATLLERASAQGGSAYCLTLM